MPPAMTASTGSGIDIPVSWKNKTNLASLSDSAVRLRFELQYAKLYSFWVETVR